VEHSSGRRSAAVILPKIPYPRSRDSKQLQQEIGKDWHPSRTQAIAFAVEEIDAETIDRVNIYQATRMAMTAAVVKLATRRSSTD